MKALKIIGLILAIVILAILVFALVQPSEGHIERSIVINADPEVVYEEVDHVKKLDAWSPWHALDSSAFSYEGPESGVGAISKWDSDHPELGTGQYTITEAEPNKMVKTQMEFADISGSFYSTVTLNETAEGTEVTWAYDYSDLNLAGRFMTGMIDMEEMMGAKLEEGIQTLKDIAESKPAMKNDIDIKVVNVEPITYIGLEGSVDASQPEAIATTMGNLYGQLMKHVEDTNTQMTGAPIAVYKSFGKDEIEVVCGLPVSEGYVLNHEKITLEETLSGEAVKAIHHGNYDNLPFTHDQIKAFIADNELTVFGNPYEVYITDPQEVADTAQWITEVYYPLGQ